MQASFRRATHAQIPDIVALMESAYRGEASKKGWTTEADIIDGPRTSIAEITDTLNDKNGYMLVAISPEGRLIGCASTTKEGEECSFRKFAVDPTLQAAGLGKQLLAASEQIAKDHFGVSVMTMTVVDGRRELEAFYERRGYARTGKTISMRDLHRAAGMTIGHDLVLYEYAKDL